MTQQTQPELPEMPFGPDRYHVELTGHGFWPFCIRAGTGTRELFVGQKRQCERLARELACAFEDGKFMASRAAIAADRVKRFEGPVLTYEEVREICKIGDLEGVAQRQLTVRATESAVLAKLEQENNRLRAPKPRAGIDFVMMPKTGRDLYYRHVGEDRNNMHEWCELPIDEQVAWNDKAKEQS